jgi:hypothetical protein
MYIILIYNIYILYSYIIFYLNIIILFDIILATTKYSYKNRCIAGCTGKIKFYS